MLVVYTHLDELKSFSPVKRELVIGLFTLSETLKTTAIKTSKFWVIAIPVILIGVPFLIILRIYKFIRRLLG
jgi:hypothetical protein